MQVIAVHDVKGKIKALVAAAPDGPSAGIELNSWERAHAVDVPDLTLDLGDEQIHRILDDVAENFTVDVSGDSTPTAQLIPKNKA